LVQKYATTFRKKKWSEPHHTTPHQYHVLIH
jgi:hypothetical protein